MTDAMDRRNHLVVLMTDFGESEYVGVMKAVIYSLCPSATITDLTHSITPQSIREGAWVCLKSHAFYPKDSVFVCVVDPGVGTTREAVLVKTRDYTFIGPDNGLLYPACTENGIESVFALRLSEDASKTFHGRDVFAKAAAAVLNRTEKTLLSKKMAHLGVSLDFYLKGRTGEVVRIDRFGNIITNIPPMEKSGYHLSRSHIESELKLCETYSVGPEHGLFLVTGSYGTLEISARNAAASDSMPLEVGSRITLE